MLPARIGGVDTESWPVPHMNFAASPRISTSA